LILILIQIKYDSWPIFIYKYLCIFLVFLFVCFVTLLVHANPNLVTISAFISLIIANLILRINKLTNEKNHKIRERNISKYQFFSCKGLLLSKFIHKVVSTARFSGFVSVIAFLIYFVVSVIFNLPNDYLHFVMESTYMFLSWTYFAYKMIQFPRLVSSFTVFKKVLIRYLFFIFIFTFLIGPIPFIILLITDQCKIEIEKTNTTINNLIEIDMLESYHTNITSNEDPCLNQIFSSIGVSILKVTATMFGDVTYNEYKIKQNYEYSIPLNVIYIIFLFLINLVLFSVMNGVAVRDAIDLLKNAKIYQIKRKCETILEYEDLIYFIPFLLSSSLYPQIASFEVNPRLNKCTKSDPHFDNIKCSSRMIEKALNLKLGDDIRYHSNSDSNV
jgi:hypothetical protein